MVFQKPMMLELVVMERCIGEFFQQAKWLPLKELKGILCREGLSSQLRLSFYQEYIIRILSALLVSVWSKGNKSWYMSTFQMVICWIVFQGGPEFTAEVELLSRVHHKNLVSLVGFCLEQGEQILVYEYVPNGDLLDSLSGKSGIRLDWLKRLKIILGAARGLAYLHELANPPIIHRDIKSNNILLDKDLTAKVADFGLSKSMADSGTDHVTTQVKGTMGYLDPEYYMTQQLTEKSDVYSFGVVMLELITARRPIERGKYIVRVVQMAMDKTKDLYNLQEVLDPYIGLGTELKGLEIFVDLAMSCAEESQDKRPTMGEVVKVIEKITQLAALNNSTSSSASYEDVSRDDLLPSVQRSRP
ncbi:hypothetical protein ACE6H2_015092 [Prunus campanulata]